MWSRLLRGLPARDVSRGSEVRSLTLAGLPLVAPLPLVLVLVDAPFLSTAIRDQKQYRG